jgi:hypothetical protein
VNRSLVAILALAALTSAGGCGLLETPASRAAPGPTGSARSGLGSGPAGSRDELPDPCTLLTREEVLDLTAREVTQIDEDGAASGAPTRYCQWQQDSGQLAVFLSRTSAADFRVTVDGNETVDGLGDDAYFHSGHLYVLDGDVQIDVYSRGGDDLADAKNVAEALLPRI